VSHLGVSGQRKFHVLSLHRRLIHVISVPHVNLIEYQSAIARAREALFHVLQSDETERQQDHLRRLRRALDGRCAAP
jgi:hypothetical protein